MHEPVEVWVDVFQDIGGVLIPAGQEMQVRCGCQQSLALMFGHENAAGAAESRTEA